MKANEVIQEAIEKKPRKKREKNRFKMPIDEARVGKNNYVNQAFQIPFVRKGSNFKVVGKNPNGTATLEKAYYDSEYLPYAKIFVTPELRDTIAQLSLRAKNLYLHIIYNIPITKDMIYIDRAEYMTLYKLKAENTYLGAVKDLIKANILARTEERKDLFWINPFVFFRGNRFEKYPNNLLKVYDYSGYGTELIEGTID